MVRNLRAKRHRGKRKRIALRESLKRVAEENLSRLAVITRFHARRRAHRLRANDARVRHRRGVVTDARSTARVTEHRRPRHHHLRGRIRGRRRLAGRRARARRGRGRGRERDARWRQVARRRVDRRRHRVARCDVTRRRLVDSTARSRGSVLLGVRGTARARRATKRRLRYTSNRRVNSTSKSNISSMARFARARASSSASSHASSNASMKSLTASLNSSLA